MANARQHGKKSSSNPDSKPHEETKDQLIEYEMQLLSGRDPCASAAQSTSLAPWDHPEGQQPPPRTQSANNLLQGLQLAPLDLHKSRTDSEARKVAPEAAMETVSDAKTNGTVLPPPHAIVIGRRTNINHVYPSVSAISQKQKKGFCSNIEKTRLAIAIVSAMPFFINGFMAASKKTPDDIADVFERSPAFIATSFVLAGCAFGVNVILNYDYLPTLVQAIKDDLKKIKETTGWNKALAIAERFLILAPSVLSATAATVIGVNAFTFIPNEGAWPALRWPAILVNAGVSFAMTLATRYNGSNSIISRAINRNKSHVLFQQALAKAMKRTTSDEQQRIAELGRTSPKSTSTTDVDQWIIEHLLMNYQFQEMILRHKDDNCYDSGCNIARYSFATTAAIAGWVAFGQKCVDAFKNAPLPLKWIIFSIAGLPTAALYFTAVLDAFPMLYDSLLRRDTHKLYSFGVTLFVMGSCASMFNVGTNITNNNDRLVPVPAMKSNNWFAYLFPSLVAFGGAFAVNLRSGLKYTTRNRPATIENEEEEKGLGSKSIILNLEQSTTLAGTLDNLTDDRLLQELNNFKQRLLDPQPFQPTETDSPTLVLMNGHAHRAASPEPRLSVCAKICGFFSKKRETADDYQLLTDEAPAQQSSNSTYCLIQ